ncbi:MAG: hypothetical protein LBG92_10295, partial [Prevotellaceae bacterium]|nr:hypothetical protein [Prevotellaceae bacterium]
MEMYAEMNLYNTGFIKNVETVIISMTPENIRYSNINLVIRIIRAVKKVIENIQKKLLTFA